MQTGIGLGGFGALLKSVGSNAAFVTKVKQQKGNEQPATDIAGRLVMPALPFKMGELSPALSRDTIEAHVRIHKRYVDLVREMVRGTRFEQEDLRSLISSGADGNKVLARRAGEAWNHAFYWMSISPPGQDTAPTGDLLSAVRRKYGSTEECRRVMVDMGDKLFGSGWLWLVKRNEEPEVVYGENAAGPLLDESMTPLLAIDLWEHAYYLDYQSDRRSYLNKAVRQLVNWGFADRNWHEQ